MRPKLIFMLLCFLIFSSCGTNKDVFTTNKDIFLRAQDNGKSANESFRRCRRFVAGWLQHADPATGLIPRNLQKDKDIWNSKDAAADNYPFMVLTAAITDKNMFNGRMLQMLRTETKLTSRVGRLPDTYSFSKHGFRDANIDMDRIIFGSTEYVKDGLLPLTEWLGPSAWSQRMIGIVDDIWQHAPYSTSYGNIPALSYEVNGEMLQVLARLYWMTGQEKYLNYAFRLADYYLFAHPIHRENTHLKLRDHGCEIISGLTEVYVAAHFVAPARKKEYEQPIHRLLDRILEIGRNEHGMLYNWINPVTGEHDDRLCDTWGYNYDAFYSVFLIDGTKSYREAVLQTLANLNDHYRDYDWEHGSADGYADTIESGLNLINREPVTSAAAWIEYEMQLMWRKQQKNGIIEGWHGDGNFARTSIMYALWKTKGITLEPWREDVRFGAETKENSLFLSIWSDKRWQGKIKFDFPRHRDNLHLPMDYPRINQFPEWFTVQAEQKYQILMNHPSEIRTLTGKDLSTGLDIQLEPKKELQIIVKRDAAD